MIRTIGTLAAAVFLFVLVGGAAPSNSYADETPVLATDFDGAALAGEEKIQGEKDEKGENEKPKKRIKPRPYAEKLKSKIKKAPPPPPEKPKYKDWKKVLEDAEAHEGLIKVWTKQEDVYFELSKDQFDVPYHAILSLSQGIGSHFVFGGLPVDDVMFDFHRNEDHIQLRRLSVNYRAPGDEALQKAIELTYSESILEALPIVSERNNGEAVLVQVDKLYLSDISALGVRLSYFLRQPVRLDKDKGYFSSIKAFPENLEIDTRLTYMPSRPEILDLPNVPDPRAIQVGVQYSISRLPEEPMTPRLEDDRVGYFTTVHKDFRNVGEENFMVHYANRWRLEKKDPNAALSEPKKAIVFYIDHTIPEEYAVYIKEGVEWWRKAFEAAGFKNAIVAKRAPTPEEDPEYDPEDARYNTLRWNVSDTPYYGAIGPSRVDPRTGEILDADILFEHNLVAGFGKSYKRFVGPREALMRIDPGLKDFWMTDEEKAAEISLEDMPFLKNQNFSVCRLGDCMAEGGNFMRLAMLGRGLIDAGADMPMNFIGDALRFVACHEVGHALGLRHNFMSSASTPYNKLNDKTTIEDIGMTGSIMDYPTPNVALDSAEQGYYYSPTVGTSDLWAIKWGYSEVPGDTPEAQKAHIDPIAAESWKKENLYGADEDAYPAHALDPRCNIWDLSDDPLQWAIDRTKICDDLLKNGKLEDRVVSDGDNFVALRPAVITLYVQKYLAGGMIAVKQIGGQYTSRAHKGDPGGRPPLEPVPADVQRKALNFIVNNVLSVDSWTLSPETLNKMMDDKQRDWQNNPFQYGRRFDFPMSNWIAAIHSAALTNLLNPMLQQRVVEAQYKTDRPFTLSELYNALTGTIWTNNAAPRGNNAGLYRNLQRVYLDMLIQQVVTPHPFTPEDAIALSRLHLRRVRNAANTVLQRSGLNDETNAHLMETVARIDRALEASRVVGF